MSTKRVADFLSLALGRVLFFNVLAGRGTGVPTSVPAHVPTPSTQPYSSTAYVENTTDSLDACDLGFSL